MGFGLLTSAFAPLVALLAILMSDELGWVSVILLAGSAASLLLLFLVLRGLTTIQNQPIECAAVRRADEHVLAFTASYLVPVVVALMGGSGTAAQIATVALVFLLGVIYVRGGLYHLNPTLTVAGFRLYEVTAVNGEVTMLLTRRRHIAQRAVQDARYLADDVAIQLGGRS